MIRVTVSTRARVRGRVSQDQGYSGNIGFELGLGNLVAARP